MYAFITFIIYKFPIQMLFNRIKDAGQHFSDNFLIGYRAKDITRLLLCIQSEIFHASVNR